MDVINLNSEFPKDPSLLTDRSPGLHVSQIYGDLQDILFPVRKTNNKLWATGGFIWEILLELAFKHALGVRPGEILLDGVACSPDGINWKDGYVEEYKFSWKSSKKPVESRWVWMCQAMAYCKVTGLNVVRFRIFHVNGDYSFDGPIYKDCFITFTQEEIDNNWAMLIAHARSKGWLE